MACITPIIPNGKKQNIEARIETHTSILQSTTKYAQKSVTKQQVWPKCPYIDTTVVMKFGHLGQGHYISRQENHAQFILLRTETMVLKLDYLVKVERKTYLSFLAMASLVLRYCTCAAAVLMSWAVLRASIPLYNARTQAIYTTNTREWESIS